MTHIRSLQDLVMAHHSSAASRSSFTSYFAPHILSMSSDGCSDIADIPQHAAYNKSHSPPPGSQSGCNGHYNRTPDLGKWAMWWNVVGLSRTVDTRREGTRS